MKKIYLLITMLAFVFSCHRKPLEELPYVLAHIPIIIDWSKSLIDEEKIHNASIYFYSEGSEEPYKLISDDKYFAVAELPIGKYSVLIFNDFTTNISGVEFADEKDYTNFRAYTIEDENFSSENSFFKPLVNDFMVLKHDQVAAWRLGEFEVTKEMLEYTRTDEFQSIIEESRSRSKSNSESTSKAIISSDPVMESITKSLNEISIVYPTPVTTINYINIEVENLNSAKLVEGTLTQKSSGAYLFPESPSGRFINPERRNVYNFRFIDATYDDNTNTDGELHHMLITFGGYPGDETIKYELELNVILQSGEMITEIRDVTKEVTTYEDIIYINLRDDHRIVLPISTGDFDVDPWGDGEDVEI